MSHEHSYHPPTDVEIVSPAKKRIMSKTDVLNISSIKNQNPEKLRKRYLNQINLLIALKNLLPITMVEPIGFVS